MRGETLRFIVSLTQDGVKLSLAEHWGNLPAASVEEARASAARYAAGRNYTIEGDQ